MATTYPDVIPMIAYENGPAAMDWLSAAFGFKERTRMLGADGRLSHGEMAAGQGLIMLASRELATLVAGSGYRPGIILGIARGGLLPAAAMAYALDVKNVFMMSVEFYTGVDQRLDFPVMLPPLLNAVDIKGAQLLVVDDVADTGGTLKLVKEFCAEHVADVRCAVLFEKPRSLVKCEYVFKRTDRWVNFPWSSQPPVAIGS